MTNDIVADMLTRLRNANLVQKLETTVPKTKLTVAIAQVLLEEGFIKSFQIVKSKGFEVLRIILKYIGVSGTKMKPALTYVERVSKPGRRIYVNRRTIPVILGGLGIALITTSKGVMTDRQAREKNLGGELLCIVY